MDVFKLSRDWFDFSFENPEKIKPNHAALYFFCIEHCNRLGWKGKFGLPTTMAKEAIGISSYNTYINTLRDLCDWGFIKMIEKSKNQYSSNIIAISNFDKALDKALDKAMIKHSTKHVSKQSESIDSIDIQETNIQTNKKQETIIELYPFDEFWNEYGKKNDLKKCKLKWDKILDLDKQKIKDYLPEYKRSTPEIKYRKNPMTFLNNECWNDEIIQSINSKNSIKSNYKVSDLIFN